MKQALISLLIELQKKKKEIYSYLQVHRENGQSYLRIF